MNATKNWYDRDQGEFKPKVIEICVQLNALEEPTRAEVIANMTKIARAQLDKGVGDE